MEKCIFCKLSSNKGVEKIYENKNFFSIYDIKPEVKGHALVISKKHFKTALELPNNLADDLFEAIKKTVSIVEKKFNADGFNIINNGKKAGGQLINHVHFHILPRKFKDKFRWGNLEKKKKEVLEILKN